MSGGDPRSRVGAPAGTATIFASTIALTVVVGMSLLHFPFGTAQAPRGPGSVAAATAPPATTALAADTPSVAPSAPATASPGPTRTAQPTHRLTIATHPAGARVTITPEAGGRQISGRSPLTATVREGRARVHLAHRGRRERTAHVTVDADHTATWWLDPEGQRHRTVARVAIAKDANDLALRPGGDELWVARSGRPGIEVFTARSGRHRSGIDLGADGAATVIFTADGATAYAAAADGVVHEIDAATSTVRRTLAAGDDPASVLALSPDEQHLFVADPQRPSVTQLDLASGTVARTITTVARPSDLHVSAEALYVAGGARGDLERIALDSGRVTTLTLTGGALPDLVVDERRGKLYVSDTATGSVFAHPLGTDGVAAMTAEAGTPGALALGGRGRVLYTSWDATAPTSGAATGSGRAGAVLALDADSGARSDTIATGGQVTALAAAGGLLAVLDATARRVHVYACPDALDAAGS